MRSKLIIVSLLLLLGIITFDSQAKTKKKKRKKHRVTRIVKPQTKDTIVKIHAPMNPNQLEIDSIKAMKMKEKLEYLKNNKTK
jgi:Flp pilus assembly protein TadB